MIRLIYCATKEKEREKRSYFVRPDGSVLVRWIQQLSLPFITLLCTKSGIFYQINEPTVRYFG